MLSAFNLHTILYGLCDADSSLFGDLIVLCNLSADWATDGIHFGHILRIFAADALDADDMLALKVDLVLKGVLDINSVIAIIAALAKFGLLLRHGASSFFGFIHPLFYGLVRVFLELICFCVCLCSFLTERRFHN